MADPVWVDDVTPLNAVNMTKLQTRDEKAVANGYPSLGSDGKVPAGQLPPAGGAVAWKGAWVSGTAYQPGDLVSYGGRYWMAADNSTGVAPT